MHDDPMGEQRIVVATLGYPTAQPGKKERSQWSRLKKGKNCPLEKAHEGPIVVLRVVAKGLPKMRPSCAHATIQRRDEIFCVTSTTTMVKKKREGSLVGAKTVCPCEAV
nr:hypothetical protein [Pandoravirus massiliensis]